MKFAAEQYAQALHDSLQTARDADHEKILDNFVRLLQQNGDLGMFDEIDREFTTVEKRVKGIKTAEVSSARPLSESEQALLVRELNDYLGGKVELKQKIDAGILGGVIVQVEDKLIDGSIRGNLQNLRNNLTQ